MSNQKKCEICGKFMDSELHGACIKCLRDLDKLPTGLATLYRHSMTHPEKYDFRERHSIRGIMRTALTLVCDKDWYAVNWNPVGNLQKVLDTVDTRSYISVDIEQEIRDILSSVEKGDHNL